MVIDEVQSEFTPTAMKKIGLLLQTRPADKLSPVQGYHIDYDLYATRLNAHLTHAENECMAERPVTDIMQERGQKCDTFAVHIIVTLVLGDDVS